MLEAKRKTLASYDRNCQMVGGRMTTEATEVTRQTAINAGKILRVGDHKSHEEAVLDLAMNDTRDQVAGDHKKDIDPKVTTAIHSNPA